MDGTESYSIKSDVDTVASQANVSHSAAAALLEQTDGDVVSAILEGLGHRPAPAPLAPPATTKGGDGGDGDDGNDIIACQKIAELREILNEKDKIFQQITRKSDPLLQKPGASAAAAEQGA